jgi:hypothetical protein
VVSTIKKTNRQDINERERVNILERERERERDRERAKTLNNNYMLDFKNSL